MVASQVEHTDVGADVRLLLLSQPGRYKRQGGMAASANRGVSGVLERGAMQGGQSDP